jgi:predicted RNA binding protein YcfA (HicA-like mRNA interferase family)
MKQKDLERLLRMAGCSLKCEGASHASRVNPQTGTMEAVPLHAEIKEPLAIKILKSLDA